MVPMLAKRAHDQAGCFVWNSFPQLVASCTASALTCTVTHQWDAEALQSFDQVVRCQVCREDSKRACIIAATSPYLFAGKSAFEPPRRNRIAAGSSL